MFNKPKTLFGLDIGTSYIKAVQLKKLKQASYELEIFEILPIPPGLVDDGVIIDKDKLAVEIKSLIKKANIKTPYAAVSISGHSSVIIKIIPMPDLTEEEMTKSIRFEAEQYVPFGMDDVILDFQILGKRQTESANKDEKQVDVLIVAVKKDLLEGYYNALESAEITPAVIDVTAFALANMYEFNYGGEISKDKQAEPDQSAEPDQKAKPDHEKVVAIFDVGAGNINMTVIKKNNPIFTRDSQVGARIILEALEKNLQIDYNTAEGILKDGSLPAGMSSDEVSPVIMNASEEVMTDIIGSIDYYTISYNERIDKVVVCGGGALLGQFVEILAERTGLEVIMADPFKNIIIPDTYDKKFIKTMGTIGSAAVGLALREVGDK